MLETKEIAQLFKLVTKATIEQKITLLEHLQKEVDRKVQ